MLTQECAELRDVVPVLRGSHTGQSRQQRLVRSLSWEHLEASWREEAVSGGWRGFLPLFYSGQNLPL